ncbi:MAG: hypothetical protein AB1Z55_04320 [Acidimicrobiia bacterium]
MGGLDTDEGRVRPTREVVMTDRTMTQPSTVVLRDDLAPICPHCEAEVPEIYARRPKGPFGVGRGFVFFCPHCRKVMGFGAQWYPFFPG